MWNWIKMQTFSLNKCKHSHLRKCISKYCLQNDNHFVQSKYNIWTKTKPKTIHCCKDHKDSLPLKVDRSDYAAVMPQTLPPRLGKTYIHVHTFFHSFRINSHYLPFCWQLTLAFKVNISPNLPHFELDRTIAHHPFKLESPNLDQRWKTPWLRSLFWGLLIFVVKFKSKFHECL